MSRAKKLKKKEIEEINNSAKNFEKKDKSPFIYQDSKLKEPINIRIRDDLTEKQKALIELIKNKNTKIVFISGPAGVSKTYTSVQAGLELLNEKRHSELLYCRSAIESASKSLGYLPGDQKIKEEVYMIPLKDKLSEFLDKGTIDFLEKDNRIKSTVVNYLRGQNFNAKFILIDEFQNFTFEEAVTILTRIGKFTTMVFTGDMMQADIKNSGFKRIFELFDTEKSRENGIFCVQFTTDDIVRSGVCKFIVETLEQNKKYQ